MNKVLLKFGASFCAPCKALGMNMDILNSKGLLNVDEIQYFDVDEHRDVAIEFNIRSVPTLILMIDGNEIQRTTGYLGDQKILDFIG